MTASSRERTGRKRNRVATDVHKRTRHPESATTSGTLCEKWLPDSTYGSHPKAKPIGQLCYYRIANPVLVRD
jgi:hypothetical protein